ncbi:glycerol uptake operon antiterminator [Desulfohalotomaculum tongense]|uniref:glycerol-3-phosphate responsive antiterminator n=1 Tax=Desulforadius tongensis TaxID=1216062 RepID=UPI00195D6CF3|nr:glycerol-3-phosphate responsive antiterminator [Desulforadius tongensis]MBM7855993.1 glycerol uptake operon antiterminator [Desulforadius tongensis]
MGVLEKIMKGKKIGAAIRRVADLPEALCHSNIGTIFLLGGDINYLPSMIKKVRAAEKVLLVHMDLIEGVGRDRAGMHLLKRLKIHGIVTTKTNLVKYAREEGLWVIQRFFIVDSESLKTAIKVAGNVKPTAVEILPATVPRYTIEEMKKALGVPVLGGGLLKTEEDVKQALAKGLDGISTSRRHLWNIDV